MIRTLNFRLKDKHAPWLNNQAREVNFVWNYCNELSFRILKKEHRFVNRFELQHYTDGASKECSLHSHTIQAIGKEYVTRRRQFKKSRLAWRKSGGVRRSLGWIPFKAGSVKYKGGQVFFNGQLLSLWDSYGLSNYSLKAGCFSEDSRGRWYLNVQVELPDVAGPRQVAGAVGLDLGLKEFLATSDGVKVEAQRFYRDMETALGLAQRAGKKQRVKAIHAKIKARRKDSLHKLSTELVNSYGAIFVGNVSSTKLAKTKMAKSVLDAGWGMFKTQLQYKGASAGCWVQEINEAYSSQTCSCCGVISANSPKGRAGLRIREWTCGACGTKHDRDSNAAINIRDKGILAVGRGRLVEGNPEPL